MSEKELYTLVIKSVKKGNTVEIRQGKDGELKIFEIKKNKVL